MPDSYQSFSQQTGLVQGELVWFPSQRRKDTQELGCVWAIKAELVLIISAYDGEQHNVHADYVMPSDDDGRFMAWKAAVVQGAQLDREAKAPGQRGFHDACFRDHWERVASGQPQWDDPHQMSGEQAEYTHGVHTNEDAKEADAMRELQKRSGERYTGESLEKESDATKKSEDSNATMYILLAGGVVLALMFSR